MMKVRRQGQVVYMPAENPERFRETNTNHEAGSDYKTIHDEYAVVLSEKFGSLGSTRKQPWWLF